MESIKGIIYAVVMNILQMLALISFGLAAPLLYVTVPFYVILTHTGQELRWFTESYMLLGPLASGVWMILICHWSSVRQWQRDGKDLGILGSHWREAHGGLGRTAGKSTGFMLLGLFGSIVAEYVYLVVFHSLLVPPQTISYLLFYTGAPFAVFAPVWLTFLYRRRKAAQEKRFWDDARERYRLEMAAKDAEIMSRMGVQI